MPKSVIMSQTSMGKSTLNEILRSEEKFKAEKVELEPLKRSKKLREATLTGWTAPFTSGFVRNVSRAVQ